MLDKNLAQSYVNLQAEIDLLEAQKTAMREKILSELQKSPEKKEVTEWGTFTVVPTTKWEYTDAVKKLEDKVKITKTKEQKKGLAKPIVSESLRFTTKKED